MALHPWSSSWTVSNVTDRQQVQYLIVEVALGTLANLTVTGATTQIDASRDNGMRIKQLKAAVSFKGKTAGEGPLIAGLCAQDLTNAEIAEALVADPQKTVDTPSSEQGNRRVFPIWNIGPGLVADDSITELKEVHYPWKMIGEDEGLKFFVMNNDGSSLTTGTTMTLFAAVVGEWLRD